MSPVTEAVSPIAPAGPGRLYAPATDEVKRLVAGVERVTGCKVLLVQPEREDVLVVEKVAEAMQAAAMIVFRNANPDGEWVGGPGGGGESDEAIRHLATLVGARWSPFTAQPCLLSPREVSAGLEYLRAAFEALPNHPAREIASQFVLWAKNNAACDA